jgi:BMFP domain-containing protein YqiC
VKFRQYIHDLETRCDKSEDVQTIAILREDRDALQQRVEELEALIALHEREYLEAPIETD